MTPSQDQFSGLLGLYASVAAHQKNIMDTLAHAEVEKIGVTGLARIDAIGRYLTAHYGDKARPMLATLATAAQVEIWEDVITRTTNQGGGAFRSNGREPPASETPTDEQWNSWSYTQWKDHAERANAAPPNGRR